MPEELSHVGMTRCFYCNELGASILLDRRVVNGELRKSLPRDCGVVDMQPCQKCEELMKQGVIVIGVRDEKEIDDVLKSLKEHQAKYAAASEYEQQKMRPFIPNPYRSGHWCVIKAEAMERIFGEGAAAAVKERWTLVPADLMKRLGMVPEQPTPAETKQGD